MKRLAALALCAGLLTAASPASAITSGVLDNGMHPNVAAVIGQRPDAFRQFCSGTLIAPDVVLTAAHCARLVPADQIYVSFDDDVSDPATATLYKGTSTVHPGYDPNRKADTRDLAVIELDDPVPHIDPASLPTAGRLDSMKADGTLAGQKFTVVGFGREEPTIGGGPPTFPHDKRRRYAVSSFYSLTDAWLRLSQNAATGDGGSCFGDSGGPNFFGTDHQTVPGTIASVTVDGDAMCMSLGTTYRLDTDSARSFLGGYVTLP